MSVGLMVEDGVVWDGRGGMVTGFLPVSLMYDRAVEVATETELEMDLWRPN
jgi:hypothetical protein